MNPHSVSIYNVGGCGLNQGRAFEAKFTEAKSAELNTVPPSVFYVDTSSSNLRRSGIDQERTYLFDDMDGSGKLRAENHREISKRIPNLLQAFQPSTFNIVISSAGGGSGAVIAHSLIKELRKQELPVVLILIGTTASLIEINNSVKTLKSLDKMAHDDDLPIVCFYLENTPNAGRQAVDAAALEALVSLVALFAGAHEELDSADLKHWLKFEELGGELVALEIVRGQKNYQAIKDVVSVATLAAPGDNTHLDPTPAYQAVGYVPDNWVTNKFVTMGEPLSFCLSSDLVERASKELLSHEAEVSRVHQTRVRRDSLVGRHDQATDDGLIL